MVPRSSRSVSFSDRLREAVAAAGLEIDAAGTAAFAAHHQLLVKWGARMNLTGIRDQAEIVRRHFLEPLAAAALLENEGTLVDLGSGNGFPAIPLKVLRPGLRLVLVESSERKSAFLRAVIRELGLGDARVETRRINGRRDLEDLLPCRYLTIRAVKARLLLKGRGGAILEQGGAALLFVTGEEAGDLRRDPPSGLRFVESRPLPSGPRSVLAILGPDNRTGALSR